MDKHSGLGWGGRVRTGAHEGSLWGQSWEMSLLSSREARPHQGGQTRKAQTCSDGLPTGEDSLALGTSSCWGSFLVSSQGDWNPLGWLEEGASGRQGGPTAGAPASGPSLFRAQGHIDLDLAFFLLLTIRPPTPSQENLALPQ